MKLKIRAFIMVICSMLIMSCATGPVATSNYDRSVDFSSYRTFGFYSPLGTDAAGYESLVTQTLKSAVQREMESRGYAYAETGGDLLINFNGKLQEQTRVTQTPAPPMYYGYRRGLYSGWGGYETSVDQYTQGTLNIDMVDAKRKQLVWEGVAVGRVTDKTRADREAVLRSAVTEIFAKYPFRAGG